MPETFAEYTARLLALTGDDDPVVVMAETPAQLARLFAGRALDDLQRSPAPGRWSGAQIVSHLADSELVVAYRIRHILAAPATPVPAYDQDAWIAAQHAAASDPFESLGLFATLRGANLRLFQRLTAEERARAGMHSERGEESIAHLIALQAGHDRNHLAQIEQILANAHGGFSPLVVKPVIPAAVLEQIDVRAGTIRHAEPLAGTERLAVLTVTFADRERTIVAGIRTERPSLDAIVGRQCLFAVNLEPRKIRGRLSEGMLFDIGFADGLRPAFAVPEWPVPDGTRAG